MRIGRRSGYWSVLVLGATLTGCNATSTAPAGATLTIRGALRQGAATRLAAVMPPMAADSVTYGDPAEAWIAFRQIDVSTGADCTTPVTVQRLAGDADSAVVFDLASNPTIVTGAIPAGTYRCILVHQSDVLRFRPKTTFGSCDSTQVYTQDLYRAESFADSTYWFKGPTGARIAPSGTDAAPVDNRVLTLLTTDSAAAVSAGWSPAQVTTLGAPLVVSEAGAVSTFVWGGQGSVMSNPASMTRPCDLGPTHPTFQ